VITRFLSLLFAMAGRADEARQHVRRSGLVLDELPLTTPSLVYRHVAAEALELIGDHAGAEHEVIEMWRGVHDARGARPDVRAITAVSMHALLLCDSGRWDEAERGLCYGAELPEPVFFRHGTVWYLAARARVAAHRGELAEALALARRALDLAEPTDALSLRARVWLATGAVQRAAGAVGEAEAAVANALALFEQKGNTASAARVRTTVPERCR
jgi:hypothetical protein